MQAWMIGNNNNLFNPEMIQAGCCCPEKRREWYWLFPSLSQGSTGVSLNQRNNFKFKDTSKSLLAEQSLIIKESLPSLVTLNEYGYVPKGDTRSHLLIEVKLCWMESIHNWMGDHPWKILGFIH